MNYIFKYEDKEIKLSKDNLIEVINDEEMPIEDINIETIIKLLNEGEDVKFEKAYYSTPCEKCDSNFKEKRNISEYLEYYFYVYTKDNKFVISDISKEYENLTYNRLELEGKVDNSYIVTVIVCANCNEYLVQIEEIEV
ncbi:hypothetical protein U729_159 [Clostridium baratii str. Sullivan]|uniref:DUF3785 domain-containing protein n=2 Tax=Clostridium baratii TaxID=1561 RepID=A0A0A7FUK8_9CLOT|nr:DUF3785 family protein [Clostridium baratii]AIY83284.1 hypothetical protein U729_159 [Clostridium baratii str. Sullivan]